MATNLLFTPYTNLKARKTRKVRTSKMLNGVSNCAMSLSNDGVTEWQNELESVKQTCFQYPPHPSLGLWGWVLCHINIFTCVPLHTSITQNWVMNYSGRKRGRPWREPKGVYRLVRHAKVLCFSSTQTTHRGTKYLWGKNPLHDN